MRLAARLLASYPSTVEPGIREVVAGRDWLRQNLLNVGFKVIGGKLANHVLVDMRSSSFARAINYDLKRQGINIKGDFPPPLERHLLITCGPEQLMKRFFRTFFDAVLHRQEEEKCGRVA